MSCRMKCRNLVNMTRFSSRKSKFLAEEKLFFEQKGQAKIQEILGPFFGQVKAFMNVDLSFFA